MFGYESLQNDFKRLIKNNALNHAYLFYGEPEVGKFLFAQELAAQISNPSDITIIDFKEEEGNLPAGRQGTESVGIEKVRELEHFLYQTPSSMGNYRVAIIRDAHWLTDQAQNALLKILEEPPKSGIILATATDPGVFLPAVRSRFQLVFMPILTDEQILDFLKQYDIIENRKLSTAEKESFILGIVKRAHGRIGRAKKLAETPEENFTKALQISKRAMQATSGTEKKKVSDEIIEFFDADPNNADLFIETLTECLDPKKDAKALKALCEFALNLQTATIQKRIHIKRVLWMIQ